MEKPVLKIFITLLSIVAGLGLTGCASTAPGSSTPLVSSGSTGAVPVASRSFFGTAAPRPIIPDGPLQPITAAEAASMAVARLTTPADLWERMRRGFAMPDLQGPLVQDREQWYATRPDYIFRMTERSRKYLFHIVEELERRNMPTELALLPFIESAFNPQAVSSAKAAGMWQFMPATGKTFELKQNAFRDDRRDVLASTRAALDYLQKLYGMFGDWHLALAAYNWGEGSVARAIAKNQRLGLGTAYTDLTMPMETRFYVPKLQAVKNIVSNPKGFSASLPDIGNHPYFQTVAITRDIDVALAAKLAEVPLEDFKALNPSASRPVILAAGTPQILLPWDSATVFERNLQGYGGGRLASWTAWIVPMTMQAAQAAKRVGIPEADLRAINNIPPRMTIKAGSTLLVPRAASVQDDVTMHVAENGQLALAPEAVLRRSVVKAGKHDSVASIAKRYRVSTASVAEWNKVSAAAVFVMGQQIVLFSPTTARPEGKPAAKSTGKAAPRKAAKPVARKKSPSIKVARR
jgi:membrane-bound lytic murein transglycosylase D